MLTSTQIRQQFLDFFREKKHTIVPSSSLMPDSPNLLFTNAGMNQFVPIFLGERAPDVDTWSGAIKGSQTRAADTQKCIRAGGKHNDLDDVGLDTYHHTFFEMLGNWSFGDYFKKEAIAWSWELIVERFKFPPQRVYASIYQPGPGDPSERDQEAYDLWAERFRSVGLDPDIHIVNGGKKDNFWMMGETGPCGPCSEIHIDLTPEDRTVEMEQRGATLVNGTDARCIEIWNNVFIQFNAEPATPEDAVKMQQPNAKAGVDWQQKFVPLPAKHVDTGMGFERLTSIIQGTKGFTNFATANISNYETDIFRPIFDKLEKMSGKHYGSTLPLAKNSPDTTRDGPGATRADPDSTRADPGATRADPGATRADPGATRADPGATRDGPDSTRDDPGATRADPGATRDGPDSTRDGPDSTRDGPDSTRAGPGATRDDPVAGRSKPNTDQIAIDVAFRVIADHIRTLSFAIADGIQPGNTDRNYVLRRILRRAVRYGRTLGFREPFFYKLTAVLARTMGDVFPEIRAKQKLVEETLKREEEAFNKTLDRGIRLFEFSVNSSADWDVARKSLAEKLPGWEAMLVRQKAEVSVIVEMRTLLRKVSEKGNRFQVCEGEIWLQDELAGAVQAVESNDFVKALGHLSRLKLFESESQELVLDRITGSTAFELYDTYGFPLDLTELMARERGLTVDVGGPGGFNKLMEEQRARARAAQKKQVIELSEVETKEPTKFVGYDSLSTPAKVLEVVSLKDRTAVILDTTTAYAEMGGQVGDTGELSRGADTWRILNTQKSGATWLHFVEGVDTPDVGAEVTFGVEVRRRRAIERHHTVTHLLHWALHEVVSKEATQKGSFVGPDKLTFDFNSAALTPAQVRDIERLVNERIVENSRVAWIEVPYADVRGRADVMQFFGDKYGETVRVVQVGGHLDGNGRPALDGYSMELCAGTHTRATGEIGLFRINAEAAIAAGVRRIEAIAGLTAYDMATADMQRLHALAVNLGTPLPELEKRIEGMLVQHKELERALKSAQQREAAGRAKDLIAKAETINGIPAIIANLGALDADAAVALAEALKGSFPGVVVLGTAGGGSVALIASVGKEHQAKVQAGKIIQTIAPIVGGKGGGKPDFARGGGKDASKLDEALAKAKAML
jgi:alanyl-tRNA synthetase